MPTDSHELHAELANTRFAKNQVALLLGSDENIPHETRVGLTPDHLVRLRDDLTGLGVGVDLLVLEGAGERAGFPDDAYRAVGAELIDEAGLAARAAVDVVHALKEPTDYESRLPGPFLRIGAVHLASKPAGVCAMLARRNFAAVIDGGTVGNCSYLHHGGDRTPIVGSMSRFAGWVAAQKLVDHVRARHPRGRVVVVGGGIAGTSAAEKLLPIAEELVVVERYEPIHDALHATLTGLGFPSVSIRTSLDDDAMNNAIGIVFAHRSGAKAAEKVCTLAQIEDMKPGAGIADIAIDQGGSILHPGYEETDDAATARDKYTALFQDRFYYYAEVNMPREKPHEASKMHGDAVLPYLEALLLLSAIHGDPTAVAAELLLHPARRFTDAAQLEDRSHLDCLIQDLRNGLQLAITHGAVAITDTDIAHDESMRGWVDDCSAG